MSAQVKIGCCGFSKAREEYFRRFPVVEVQATFYKPPRLETALRWRAEAPPEFEFTLKAWQLITHPPSSPTYRRLGYEIDRSAGDRYGFFRPTAEVGEAWKRTEEIARALQAKVIVFQCPASFRPGAENERNLLDFFSRIDRKEHVFAWEPRGKWGQRTIREICRKADLIHCVDPFQADQLHGRISYFRLHGVGGYRYRFTDRDLGSLAKKIPNKGETYCLFNNLAMFQDAGRFQNKSEVRSQK